MLTYAARMPPPIATAIVSARGDPYLREYVLGWSDDDVGVVGVSAGRPVGGAWLRRWAPGSDRALDEDGIPELAIGIAPHARGRGLGSALMHRLVARARRKFDGVVLSVRNENPAVDLYRRFGFATIREMTNRVGSTSLVMRLHFS